MSQQENRISDSPFSKWIEDSTPVHDHLEVVVPSAARAGAREEAGAELARQLNGPMTALLLYMGEIKQHSHQLSQAGSNRVYLQQVVENALQQNIHNQMSPHGQTGCTILPQYIGVRKVPFGTKMPGREARALVHNGWMTTM